MTFENQFPTIVSFAAGGRYYFDAADRLEADCQRLEVPYDIVRLPELAGSWVDLCRYKISFISEMLEKHRSIVWLDVDTILYKRPDFSFPSSFDFMAFGGRFRYLREFDRYDTARFWLPVCLYFGDTQKSRDFVSLMSKLARVGGNHVTDDWVLQEAWERHEFQMLVGVLPPEIFAKNPEQVGPETVLARGVSGNVGEFRGTAIQHAADELPTDLKAKVLAAEAKALMKQKHVIEAVVLAKQAYRAYPIATYKDLYEKYHARYFQYRFKDETRTE